MKKQLAQLGSVIFTALAIGNSVAVAGDIVQCKNDQGRNVVIQSGSDNSYSAVLYTHADVGPAFPYQNLIKQTPRVLGAPTIYSNENFSLTVLSNADSTWGTLDVPFFGISSESVTCN